MMYPVKSATKFGLAYVLFISVGMCATEIKIIYIDSGDPARDTVTYNSVKGMVNNLNAGRVSAHYSIDEEISITNAAAYMTTKNLDPDNVVLAIHGVFDTSTPPVFQNKVIDADGLHDPGDLAIAGYSIYCGKNNDNKDLSTNDLGHAMTSQNGGTYTDLPADRNKKMDSDDENEDGDPADSGSGWSGDTSAAGSSASGTSGESSGTSGLGGNC